MAVEDPGTLTVTCDLCSETMDMDTTEYVGGEGPMWGVDDATLKENGWGKTEDGIVCPDCKEDDE